MKLVAAVPLKETALVPVKPLPLMVTFVPTGPLVGVNEVIPGPTMTVKSVALVAVPAALVTLMGPVVAPAGMVARISLSDATLKVMAAVPLNETALTPVKFEPESVTSSPTTALVGVKALWSVMR